MNIEASNSSTIESRYGKVYIKDQEDLIIKSLKIYGEWAGNELAFLGKIIRKGDVVLDIGTYLGTHLLAFSQFVGDSGSVIGFEPQKDAFELVCNTININKLSNASVNNFALGTASGILTENNSKDVEEHNHGSFSLAAYEMQQTDVDSVSDLDSHLGLIKIRDLDSLQLPKVDFLKIDAEGMELDVLNGGEKTILKNMPILFCECNDFENGCRIWNWANGHGFKVVGINIPAYDETNFNHSSEDFFAGASEVSLILYAQERESDLSVIISEYNFRQMYSEEDIYLFLLGKKQNIQLMSPFESKTLHYDRFHVSQKKFQIEFDISENRDIKGVLFGIPFYKSPELVKPLFNSLLSCSDELVKFNAKVVFYNDSPDDEALKKEFSTLLESKTDFSFEIIQNEENLGFIGTTNKSIQYAIELDYDLIMLNSDTRFFPGVLGELISVAYTDPMIGFVSPRSNNATICTFPHDAPITESIPTDAWTRYMSVAKRFPRYSFVPTTVGFCLFVKNKIISEFGLLDSIYGKGYNEENDFIMRANRCGYSAVLANHAYVWHDGEKSFSTLDIKRNLREAENAKILHDRYPEFPKLISNYFNSVEYRSESLIEGLLPDSSGKLNIAFDFTSLGTYHNGTFEAGKQLIYAADKCWSEKYNIHIICGKASWEYHNISENISSRVYWCSSEQFDRKFAAVVRIGQPFSVEALSQVVYRAPVVACFMLDTIASDCGYLKLDFDQNIWRFLLKTSDVIFTNSFYTASQFFRRYQIGDDTVLQPSLHSTTLSEYYFSDSMSKDVKTVADKKSILIIGNKFEHKALKLSVPLLSKKLPDVKIIVLGSTEFSGKNIECVPTGQMSDDKINELYESVDALIFPSHYEGFGFPLLHGLAHNKKVFVRDIPVYHEISAKIQHGKENIIFFNSLPELQKLLTQTSLEWAGASAVGESDGWIRSATEVIRTLEPKIANASLDRTTERFRFFELMFMQNLPGSTASASYSVQESIAARIANVTFRIVRKLLGYPVIYKVSRSVWRLYKKTMR